MHFVFVGGVVDLVPWRCVQWCTAISGAAGCSRITQQAAFLCATLADVAGNRFFVAREFESLPHRCAVCTRHMFYIVFL